MSYLPSSQEVRDSYLVEQREGKRLPLDLGRKRPHGRYFLPDMSQWWRQGIPPQRDSYRQRCYRAEDRAIRQIEQRKFADIGEVAKYVRDFMEKAWFQRRFPWFRLCVVGYARGTSISRGGPRGITPNGEEVETGSITLSTWGMRGKGGGETVVLHELAHAVLPHEHHHDRRWVRTYLEFIGNAFGQPVKRIFMEEFRREGVPYNPVKKIKFSEQHMLRLAAARPNPRRSEDVGPTDGVECPDPDALLCRDKAEQEELTHVGV